MFENHINNLIQYFTSIKIDYDKYLNVFGPVDFPIRSRKDFSDKKILFDWYVWKTGKNLVTKENFMNICNEDYGVNCESVLVYGDCNKDDFLVRIHSGCITGDVFNSAKCDCGFQLNKSIRLILENGAGMIVYISSHEGRGIGLFAKAICNKLQEKGLDTYEANNALGFRDEERRFDEVAGIIRHFRQEKAITLLSNNPYKINWMEREGIKIKRVLPLSIRLDNENLSYLTAKKGRGENIIGVF